MIRFKRTREKGDDFLRSIAELFDDWAGNYDEEIDDIGGPLTGYRDSIKKAYKNYPEAAENVLDIGIGTGNFIAEYIEDAKNIYGVDISPKMLEEAIKEVSRLLKQGGTLNLLDIGFNNKGDMDDAKEKYREE